jgi:hypothetical protein
MGFYIVHALLYLLRSLYDGSFTKKPAARTVTAVHKASVACHDKDPVGETLFKAMTFRSLARLGKRIGGKFRLFQKFLARDKHLPGKGFGL